MPYARTQPTPDREVDIDVALVRRLLEDQHPDLAERELRLVDEGWDNVIFRLGDDLSVRVPRRAIAAPLAESEQRWLPVLAPRLPLPVPAPVRLGTPALGYPWTWSICPWLPGDRWMDSPPTDLTLAATDLARFLGALHQPAPSDAPKNPFRGVALIDRDAATRDRIARLGRTIDTEAVTGLWDRVIEVPRWSQPLVWVHGDPHAANLLVHDGRLSAVLDFGDLGAGDPAPDLAVAWVLFGRSPRTAFRNSLPHHDADTWRRAHGWALNFALMYLADCNDDPGFLAMGRHTMSAVLDEHSSP